MIKKDDSIRPLKHGIGLNPDKIYKVLNVFNTMFNGQRIQVENNLKVKAWYPAELFRKNEE